MNNNQKIYYEERARILKAMAHPTRLFIIEELNKEERCVNELTEMVGADTSTVSKHLLILKNAGIVRDDKRGTSIYYSLKMPCVLHFIGCIETVIESNVQEQMKVLSVKQK